MTLTVFLFSAAACGQQNFTGTAGAIQSPNYPQDYPDNTICRYQIFAPAGSKVRRNVYCKKHGPPVANTEIFINIPIICLFVFLLYVAVNNFSVTFGQHHANTYNYNNKCKFLVIRLLLTSINMILWKCTSMNINFSIEKYQLHS